MDVSRILGGTEAAHSWRISDSLSLTEILQILVYTGDQKDLYSRIRRGLSRVLPSDRYTVFNISAEAVRKQPWIEKTTVSSLPVRFIDTTLGVPSDSLYRRTG